jgi:hypothetical protein
MALVEAATSVLDESSNDNKPTSAVTAPITPSASPPPHCVSPALDEVSVSSSTTSKKNKESFADTLMNLLLDEEYSKIVTFLPDDQSFGIINAKVFADEVMPKVFGIRTFSSFVRKLTRWGFERIMEKKTHDVDVFRHDLFHKNDWKSCASIKCVRRLTAKQTEKQSAVIVMQQQVQRPTFIKTLAPPPVCHSQTRALHDVTSEVVSAALATLRRDQSVAAPAPPQMTNSHMQQLIARQRVRAQMMALRHSRSFASQSMGMM